MKNLDKANEWLQRAKSNMARAKAGRVSPDILNEDLCYDAQQAVEKAFKSVCIIHEIVFPKTHDIAYLIELLEKGSVEVPENLQNAKILTGYAVETRYPGDYEPVDEEDLMRLKASYRRVYNEGTEYEAVEEFGRFLTSRQLKVKQKTNNVAGLQIADLVAHPSYRATLARKNKQSLPLNFGGEIAQILEKEKYYRSPNGRIDGWGRKCLP